MGSLARVSTRRILYLMTTQRPTLQDLAEQILDAWYESDAIEADTQCGLRAMYADQDCSTGARVANSSVWEDGNWTEEELNGASAVKLGPSRGITIEMVTDALRTLGMYANTGRVALLIGSHNSKGGEDIGEVVLHQARVIASWEHK